MKIPLLESPVGTKNQNQIISELAPRDGATLLTAKGIPEGLVGVEASRWFARADLSSIRIHGLEEIFDDIWQHTGIPPAFIAAIASRESRVGEELTRSGWGDRGNAFGVMQVDRHAHAILGIISGEYGAAHFAQAVSIIIYMRNRMIEKFPDWTVAQRLKAAAAAYNIGPENVKTYENMDMGTTHNDYSNDVWSRARYFAGLGAS